MSRTLPAPDTSDFRRRFYRLAFLNVLSNLTVPFASLVDTALLGHLDEVRFLAGVALASVLFDYIYWTFGFLRMGTTGTTAQAVGREDRVEVFQILYRSLLLAGIVAACLLALQWTVRELGFVMLSGSPEVEAAGRDYFNARIWGAPATLSNFVLLGWFLGREQSGRALLMTAVANLANIGLDYLFIVRMGMAAFGAGLGTALSQYLALGTGIILLISIPQRPRWSWREIWQPTRMGDLLRLNRDILVRTVALVTAFSLFTNFSSILGTVTLAANTVLLRYLMLAAYLIDGAAFATESLAGILRGQGNRGGLKRLLRLAMGAGASLALPILLLVLAIPERMIALITDHAAIAAQAMTYHLWLVPVLGIGSIAYIWDGFFLGLTAARPLRRAMLISTLAFFLPLALWALHLRSNHLLWAAMAAFMLIRSVTLWLAWRRLPERAEPRQ